VFATERRPCSRPAGRRIMTDIHPDRALFRRHCPRRGRRGLNLAGTIRVNFRSASHARFGRNDARIRDRAGPRENSGREQVNATLSREREREREREGGGRMPRAIVTCVNESAIDDSSASSFPRGCRFREQRCGISPRLSFKTMIHRICFTGRSR
jgi:hypothetical protein